MKIDYFSVRLEYILCDRQMSNGKISSRPISIAKLMTILEKPENAPKFAMGPTAANPGPMLLTQDTAAVNDVIKSFLPPTPSKEISKNTRAIRLIYSAKNSEVVEIVSSSLGFPFNLGWITLRGWMLRIT